MNTISRRVVEEENQRLLLCFIIRISACQPFLFQLTEESRDLDLELNHSVAAVATMSVIKSKSINLKLVNPNDQSVIPTMQELSYNIPDTTSLIVVRYCGQVHATNLINALRTVPCTYKHFNTRNGYDFIQEKYFPMNKKNAKIMSCWKYKDMHTHDHNFVQNVKTQTLGIFVQNNNMPLLERLHVYKNTKLYFYMYNNKNMYVTYQRFYNVSVCCLSAT